MDALTFLQFFFNLSQISTFEIVHFFSHESEAVGGKRILISSKTKCFILSPSFFTQFCSEGVANVLILAKSQLPRKDQIQAFPSSPAPGQEQLLGAAEVSQSLGLFGESSARDRIATGWFWPSQGHRSRAGMGRDRSHAGTGAPAPQVGSHLSHPCTLRVLPRAPECFHCSPESSRDPSPVLAKPRNGHSSPAGKICLVWVG